MNTRVADTQINDDAEYTDSVLVSIGWPLAITICGTVVLIGVLANVFIWWTKTTGSYGDNVSRISNHRDLESQRVLERSPMSALRPRFDHRVLVKKRHLRSRATLSNFTWESDGDCAAMRPLPAQPVLSKYHGFEYGGEGFSTNATDQLSLRSSRKSRKASMKSTTLTEGLSHQQRLIQRPPLPAFDESIYGFRNWGSSNPAINRARSCPNNPSAPKRLTTSFQKLHQYPVQSSSEVDECYDPPTCLTRPTSSGTMPRYSKSITPRAGTPDTNSVSPMVAPISHLEDMRLTNQPEKPRQAYHSDTTSWLPKHTRTTATTDGPHVSGRSSGEHCQFTDHSSNAEPSVNTTLTGVREHNSPSSNRSSQSLESERGKTCYGSHTQDMRRQRAVSTASGTSSARSAPHSEIASECEPFYLQNLLVQTSCSPPPWRQGVTTPVVDWNAWRQLESEQLLSKVKTASWTDDAVSS